MTTRSEKDDDFPEAPAGPKDEAEITADYRAKRTAFRLLARRMRDISKGTGGFRSTGEQMYWSSVLFTRLTIMAKSIILLTPVPGEPKAHWDFSAVASLVRNFSECYFMLYFLCANSISEDERRARVLMMHLHDNFTRFRMFKDLNSAGYPEEHYESQKGDLMARIESTAFFSKLEDKQKSRVLKGDRLPFVQDDLLREIGFDSGSFRAYYRLFSSYTHTGPLSFYRMAENGGGSGFETSIDKGYMAIALGLAIDFAERACEEVLSIFPNAETRGAQVSDRNIGRHLQKLAAAQERGEIIDP